jgi:ankyrin repeat protein
MHLRKISEATNKAALLNLEYLPTSLKQYYEEAIDRIRKQPVSHFELARRGLGLMSHAKDSLTTKELQEGLCIATGDHNLDISRLTPFPIILNACLGFISNDNPSKIVEFFHATFREWLLSSRMLWSELNFDIGEICLTYLMLEDFSQPCESEELMVARRQQYPFAAYASRFWADHIRGKGESDHSEILLSFLSSSNLISSVQILPEAASRDTRLIGKPREWLAVAQSSNVIAVYFCICLDLQRTLDVVLQRDFGPLFVVPWGENYSPLHVALIMRAGDVCTKLIKKGVWTDVRDRRGMTPLHLALELSASSLTSHALQLMRDVKARIDIPDREGRTAFHYAIRYNNGSAADYMIKNYTSLGPSFWDVEGNTPLHEAVAREQHSSWIIELLLKNKFSPMVPNGEGKTALAVVVERGSHRSRLIVEKILGAADAADAAFEIPEQERSAAEAFLKSLSDQEAQAKKSAAEASLSIEQQQLRFGGRLGHLETACERGSIRTLVLLLLQGPRINQLNPGSGMTPLHHAVLANQEEATWHLLAAGADPNLQNSHGLSAKDMADKDGRSAISTLFAANQPWLDMEKPVGEGPFPRNISGRELRDVYEYGRQVEEMCREHRGGSWSYRGTNWSEYLGFRGVWAGHGGWG